METKRRVCFGFYSPQAREVSLVGSFNGWNKILPLERAEGGIWQIWVDMDPGRHEYRFLVDGRWENDPNSRLRLPNAFGSENDVIDV